MRHEQKGAFSQDKVVHNGVSDAQIPTRSLCLSSVLVVFLQPGCQTVDPEEEDREKIHLEQRREIKYIFTLLTYLVYLHIRLNVFQTCV